MRASNGLPGLYKANVRKRGKTNNRKSERGTRMNDGKELLERIEEQFEFYYELMKCRKDKSLLKQFYESVKSLLTEVK